MSVKRSFLIILILTICVCNIAAQQKKYSYQTDSELDFADFLSGIKVATIFTTKELEELIYSGNSISLSSIYIGTQDYLKSHDFELAPFSASFDENGSINYLSSLCDIATVYINYSTQGSYIKNFSIDFVNCNGEKYTFSSDKDLRIDYDLRQNVYNELVNLYGYKKRPYNSVYRQQLTPIMDSGVDEDWIRNYLNTGEIDPNEGIYEQLIKGRDGSKNVVAVLDNDGYYMVIYLSGAFNYIDWVEGEKKGYFDPTAQPNLYTVKWRKYNKNWDENAIVTFKGSYFEMFWPDVKHTDTYLKTFPLNTSMNSAIPSISSGTGIGISSEGYILTNHHVISDASEIYVKGIEGDFSSRIKCDLIISDERNDLALLKIVDGSTLMSNPPFVFRRNSLEVGSDVFALGYPLRSSMGDEIKLTNGIVSTRTGFQGDITTYQLTVPVQPGNSGGPLFSEQGELAGIISSKHTEAENASYAIKSSYFFNLLDALNTLPKLNTQNQLSSKSMVDQVKLIKNFIYIIEAEN